MRPRWRSFNGVVHKETVAQRESARCFLFDLQKLACFQFFNAHFVSLLQNRKNMRSPVCAGTYSANAPYLFRTNINDSFLRMSSSSCIFVHFATCVKVITTPTCKRFTQHCCFYFNSPVLV